MLIVFIATKIVNIHHFKVLFSATSHKIMFFYKFKSSYMDNNTYICSVIPRL